MTSLTIGHQGEMTLPAEVQERYGLMPNAPLRLIKTRSGILLVPITSEPMSDDLTRELQEWQSLGQDAWAMFPYEDEAA